MSGSRLVAVLGYSDGTIDGLHQVCAARLEHAAAIAEPSDTVLLTGWSRSRRRGTSSEADLMAEAWPGPQRLLLDRRARSTYGNVVATAAAARALNAREVVLVTSGWHGARVTALARMALRGSGIRARVVSTLERGAGRARARELVCWSLVPVQGALARRRG